MIDALDYTHTHTHTQSKTSLGVRSHWRRDLCM